MKKYWIICLLLAVALVAGGCAERRPNKESQGAMLGMLLGGAVGGLAGSQVGSGSGKAAAIMGGAIAGAITGNLIGGSIGKNMDDYDRLMANRTLERAPTGQEVAWQNPDTGRSYEMRPTRTYKNPKRPKQYCRDYTTDVLIDGAWEQAKGTACREPDGTWRIVN